MVLPIEPFEKIPLYGDPAAPLTGMEKLVFGDHARRHPVLGFPIVTGIGALPEGEQAEQYLRQVARDYGRAEADRLRCRLTAAAGPKAQAERRRGANRGLRRR